MPNYVRYRPFYLWCFLAIVAGIAFRFWHLEVRPLHHDEAIHASFSYYWFSRPETGFYRYDPTYHGTLLYIVTQFLYGVLGAGIWQARMFPMLFGLALMASPWLFRPFLSRRSCMLASFFLAISPLMSYYSRFLAHDMPTAFFCVSSVAGLLHSRNNWLEARMRRSFCWLSCAAASLGCLFAIKAISHLWVFILATFFLLQSCIREKTLRKPKGLKHFGLFLLAAVAIFAAVYGTIETALWRNPEAFLDGLYRKSLVYWWGQHAVERIKGPVVFHLRSMLLHELPLAVLILGFNISALRKIRWGQISLVVLCGIGLLTIPHNWLLKDYLPTGVASALMLLKMERSADVFLYSYSFVAGILLTLVYLREKKFFLAFLNYWAFSALAIFSYVGEKAPWLSVHVSLPLILLVAWHVDDWLNSNVVLAKRKVSIGLALFGAFAYQMRLTYIVNETNAASRRDLLSQVHNSFDVKRVLALMEEKAALEQKLLSDMPVGIIGRPVWAFHFYFLIREMKHLNFHENGLNGNQRFVIVDPETMARVEPSLITKGYEKWQTFELDGWFVPEYTHLSWSDWLVYAWRRVPPNDAGVGGNLFHVFYLPGSGGS